MIILESAAPLHVWEAAEKVAKRSTLKRHRTGAVIFSGREIVSDGCSHHTVNTNYPSIHAEADAIARANGRGIEESDIVIVTLTQAQNYASSSRPCMKCLLHMMKVGIRHIIYAEQLNDGEWMINVETPTQLVNRASDSWNNNAIKGGYAKDMRLEFA